MKLSLFFTEGVSLKTWDTVGMLERELALYRRLLLRGIEVEFVTYGGQDDLQYAEDLSGLKIRSNQNDLPLQKYQRELVVQPPAADIFKSNQVAGAEVAMAAAKNANARFIARCGYLLSEFQENKYGNRSREAKAARKLEKVVFEGADAIVVTTSKMKEDVQSRYALSLEKISVIPNYVETDRFKPENRKPNERIRVVFVGRLDRQKNLRTFVKAVRDFDVEVWLIGYGPQREELEVLSKGSRANFQFHGNVPNQDLPQLLNECDIFVLPSLYEGHPKALLEAMACGLPALGTSVPGIQNVIDANVNGLLCEPSVDGIRDGLNSLIINADLRHRLGSAGRAFIVEHFALERLVELEIDLLNRLTA